MLRLVRHKTLNIVGTVYDVTEMDDVVYVRFEGEDVERVMGLAEGACLLGWFLKEYLEDASDDSDSVQASKYRRGDVSIS